VDVFITLLAGPKAALLNAAKGRADVPQLMKLPV
jgi:hypothetical protein